jgi:predicted phage baseplate assembly protein
MTIEAPNLDDRTFQELVDEAKLYLRERCPQWTDHNVSDPGVALVEAFAWMTESLLYRLNRVPERVYLKFLDLIGLSLRGPSIATVDVDFRLSAALEVDLTIPAGTTVATERIASAESALFTLFDQTIVRSAAGRRVLRIAANGEPEDLTDGLGFGDGYPLFQSTPQPGDGLYLGFEKPLDRHLVLVTAAINRIAGHNIDPDDPPLVWQISGNGAWLDCEQVGRDRTSGFNESGDVELALPAGHVARPVGGHDLFWLRCQVVPHERSYRSSPEIFDIGAATIGVVAACHHGTLVQSEALGESSGVSGQEFSLTSSPVVISADQDLVIRSYPQDGTPPVDNGAEHGRSFAWRRVDSFADSGPDDLHFTLDPVSGTIRFGPEVREADGSVRRYGAVPDRGSLIVADEYRTGGGVAGNVLAGAIQSLRTSVPHVARVRNRGAGTGGSDAETVDEAKIRGPLELRSRNRAVTVEDYEYLAAMASSEIGRVKCLPEAASEGVGVRLLVVPRVALRSGPHSVDELDPSVALLERVNERIDEVRLIGTSVRVEPPAFQGIAVEASIIAKATASTEVVQADVLDSLYRYFNPLTGGDAGTGWEFGRSVRVSQAFAVVQRCSGVEVVDELTLWAVDPSDGPPESWPREQVPEGVELNPNELVISGFHVVDVGRWEDE